MGVFKNDKEIIKIIASFLVEVYKSTPKKVRVPYVSPVVPSTAAPLPGLSLTLLQNFFNLVPFITYSILGVSAILILKDFCDSPSQSVELQPQNKNPKNLLPATLFPNESPKRRILPLHLCCSYSLNQYVIFTKKNYDNPSQVHINRGEVGQIIKELPGWDHALVNFSIEVPSRFKKLNTKSIVKKAFNEGIVIL